MHNLHRAFPRAAGRWDAKTYADVTPVAAGAVALTGSMNRVGAWFALQGNSTLTVGQFINICVLEQGKLRCLASLGTANPNVYLRIEDYGSVIMQQLSLVCTVAAQTVSVGDIQYTFEGQTDVDQDSGSDVPARPRDRGQAPSRA